MASAADVSARTRQACLLFALCSFAAVLVGCWAATTVGVSRQALLLNVGAWALGAALAAGLARAPTRWASAWLVVALVLLLLTLVSAGLSDVHRWFALGPLRMNAAELGLPLALASCAGLDRSSLLRLIFPAVASVVLALQPDASQAVATAAAGVVVSLTSSRPAILRVAVALVGIAAAVVSVVRPDPLAPVAQVEGVVLLAARISPVVAGLGVAAVAGSIAAPLLLARTPAPSLRDAALTLTAYSATAGLAPAVAAFPVPLMGMAVSPILGAWFGFGGLLQLASPQARRRRRFRSA